MIQVSVDEGSVYHCLSQLTRCILRNLFLSTLVDSVIPIKDLFWDITVIWFFGTDSHITKAHLCQIAIKPFGTIKMTLSWCCAESRKCHYTCLYIEASKLNHPL